MNDLIIIGGGPAGLTAAVYARRAGLSVCLYEKLFCGGQMTKAHKVENYPGIPGISGPELSLKLEEHAKALGTVIERKEVLSLDLTEGALGIIEKDGRIDALAVILAMGAIPKPLGISGEEEFTGRGVSYCASCDGNFFRNKDVCVVGGGNIALEDAVYLSGICSKVYLINRNCVFGGNPALVKTVRENENIVPLTECAITGILGDTAVTGIKVSYIKTGQEKDIPLSGVFAAIGTRAQPGLLSNTPLTLDKEGRIIAGEDCMTSIPGVFAAGDLRKKSLYQIITAASDGAAAATAAALFVRENR